MNKTNFSLDMDLNDAIVLAPPEPLAYVETVIFCPFCKNEVERHYPTLRIGVEVRYMIEAHEGKACVHCGGMFGRAGWTFTRIKVLPGDRGFSYCAACGFLHRGSEMIFHYCIGCNEMIEHRRVLQQGA